MEFITGKKEFSSSGSQVGTWEPEECVKIKSR